QRQPAACSCTTAREPPDAAAVGEGRRVTHADEMAIQYLAQQLHLDACQKKQNGLRMGVRWTLLNESARARYLKAARAVVRAWLDDEIAASASRAARLVPA